MQVGVGGGEGVDAVDISAVGELQAHINALPCVAVGEDGPTPTPSVIARLDPVVTDHRWVAPPVEVIEVNAVMTTGDLLIILDVEIKIIELRAIRAVAHVTDEPLCVWGGSLICRLKEPLSAVDAHRPRLVTLHDRRALKGVPIVCSARVTSERVPWC